MRREVRVTEIGGGIRPRVLMLPGLGNRGAGFRGLADALAATCSPVLVEYPEGVHASEGADVLARQVIQASGPCDGVIASSFGGMVAGYLAAGGHVRGAAFIGSFTALQHLGWRGPLLPLMGPIAMVRAPAVLLASIAAFGRVPFALAADVVPTTPGERSGVWHRARAVPGKSPGVTLRDLEVACVAIQGTHDLLVPRSVLKRLGDSLPAGSVTHLIRGAGHVPYITHIEECVRILRPWLKSLGSELPSGRV